MKHFSRLCHKELNNALQAFDPRSSTGEDNVDYFTLKLAAPIIAEPLRHIFNLSLTTGNFPTLWKSAHVIPLHKGGSRDDMNNYRPISKLPCLAKVMESLVNNQLKSFLSTYSVLSSHQSGFRTNHSTISAITLVTNHIISALDKKQHCAAVFVDLSKAFDTVDHDILLSKLFNIGLSESACAWFHEYLSERRQCIKSGDTKSDFMFINRGVPQGSILGPVLFSIYINDIVSSLSGCHAHLYVDDTIVYCIADSVQLAINNLQLAFDELQESLLNHKLLLNVTKTKYMLFSRARNITHETLNLVTIEGSRIGRVAEYLSWCMDR